MARGAGRGAAGALVSGGNGAAAKTPAAEVFAAELARIEHQVGTHGPLWLRRIQKSALERFRALGIPGTREEEWRQTNVTPIAKTAFRLAPASAPFSREALLRLPFSDPGVPQLVFVDGHYAPELSSAAALPPAIEVGSLKQALATHPERLEPHLTRIAGFEERPFAALNSALFEDGAVVFVSGDAQPDASLAILHVVSAVDAPVLTCPRVLIVVGANTRLTLSETFVSAAASLSFTNALTEAAIGENAELRHVRVQSESERGYHLGGLAVRLAAHSRFLSVNVSLGAALARNDIHATLDGEGAECTLDGLYVGNDAQHIDNHTTIEHARPHCASHELYKGVLAGASRAVFNGRIIVRPGAQKTDAKQSNRNLLLSDDAVVHTRPQLEIYADDVKCTHGATIGHLDDEALFYLRSRGIERLAARGILIGAFTGRVLQEIGIARLKDAVEDQVARRLLRAETERGNA